MISFSKEDIFFVTGASSGIGRASALLLNELGATVIITSRRQEKLQEVKNDAVYSENMIVESRDLSVDIDNHAEWVIGLSKKYGKLKGLVLSAGVSFVKPLSLVDYSSLKTAYDILFDAQVMLVKGFANRKANAGNSSVVIISSNTAAYGVKGTLEYGSAKAALITAGKVMANELYYRSIRVNTISPGILCFCIIFLKTIAVACMFLYKFTSFKLNNISICFSNFCNRLAAAYLRCFNSYNSLYTYC